MSSKAHEFLSRLDIKLTTYYTLLLLLIVSSLCGFLYYRLKLNLFQQIDRILINELNELSHDIEELHYDLPRACQFYREETTNRKHFPIYFKVFSSTGEPLFSSHPAREDSPPLLNLYRSPFLTFTPSGSSRSFRIHQKKVTLANGQEFIVQIATSTRTVQKTLKNYLYNIFIAIPLLVLMSFACSLYVSKKIRTILRKIINITNRISSQNLNERLPIPMAHDEIRELTDTINSMIDRLEVAFKEVKQFTSDVSHELRTPLFSIRGELELALTQQRTNEDYRETIHVCLERCNSLIKMVNDLFLISRFDMKKIDFDMLPLNLAEILKDLYDFFLPFAQEKNLNLTIEQCEDVVIRGDKTRISQLLTNLLDNAVKFTPSGGSITLSLTGQDDSAQLTVEDTGPGIPEEDIPHIFKRLYQVDKILPGGSAGSGLGLHISKRIVDAHGGTITVKSTQDKGTAFIVTLPRRD